MDGGVPGCAGSVLEHVRCLVPSLCRRLARSPIDRSGVCRVPELQWGKQVRRSVGLLDDLREATGIMVDIQARFLTVEDNFLEDIGVDFRGLGQPGLGTNNFLNDFGALGY